MRYLYYYYTGNRLNFVYHDNERTIRTSYIGYSLKQAVQRFRRSIYSHKQIVKEIKK